MDQQFSLRQRFLIGLITLIGPILLNLIGATWRIKYEGIQFLEKARLIRKNVLFCFWHSRLLGLCYSHKHRNIGIMVSKSFDGEWIAMIANKLGYRIFRGSSSRDGALGLIEMLKSGEDGDLSLTVDGPRGPARKVKPGIITLAAKGRLPLVPISYRASKFWTMNSWDKLVLPKPFAEITVSYGEYIVIDEINDENQVEQLRERIESGINKLG